MVQAKTGGEGKYNAGMTERVEKQESRTKCGKLYVVYYIIQILTDHDFMKNRTKGIGKSVNDSCQ